MYSVRRQHFPPEEEERAYDNQACWHRVACLTPFQSTLRELGIKSLLMGVSEMSASVKRMVKLSVRPVGAFLKEMYYVPDNRG